MEGPSKAEITCKDNKDGTCTVSYLPTAPGDYNIIVKFDNKHIPGSPFTAKITGEEINHILPHTDFFILLMYSVFIVDVYIINQFLEVDKHLNHLFYVKGMTL